jgi:hypothetical protein
MEPCAEVRAPFEAIEVKKRIEDAFLDDVLRILFVASQPKGEVVHISPMTLDQRQERVDIAVVHLTGSRPDRRLTGCCSLTSLLIGRRGRRAVNQSGLYP